MPLARHLEEKRSAEKAMNGHEAKEIQDQERDLAILRKHVSASYGDRLVAQALKEWGPKHFFKLFPEERAKALTLSFAALRREMRAAGEHDAQIVCAFLSERCTQDESHELVKLDIRDFEEVKEHLEGVCPQCSFKVEILRTSDGRGRICSYCGYRAGQRVKIPFCVTFRSGPERAEQAETAAAEAE